MKLKSILSLFFIAWQKIWEKSHIYYFLSAIFVLFELVVFWISLFFTGGPPDRIDPGFFQNGLFFQEPIFWIFLVSLIIGFFINIFVMASMIIVARDHEKENLKLGDVLSEALELFISYFWISFLTGLISILGVILLIIPGIIFSIWFFFAPFILVFEKRKGWSALKRGKELVAGYWWEAAFRIGSMVILSLLISGLIFVLGFVVKDVLNRENLTFSLEILVTFLIMPLFTVYYVEVYKNFVELKNRKILKCGGVIE